MKIIPFESNYLDQAAELFVNALEQQRLVTPLIPGRMAQPEKVREILARLFTHCPGVAAVEDGKLLGYLGWFEIEEFRDTDRKAALSPEWAHATVSQNKPAIIRALYRSAGSQWAADGCNVHAIGLMADDKESLETLFWSGFGLMVVDAIRPLQPIGAVCAPGYTLRKAGVADLAGLVEIEKEHWQHYTKSPIFMTAQEPDSAEAFAEFLANPVNGAWIALSGDEVVSYVRFEASSFGAAQILNASDTIAITGAYTKPAHRGGRLMPALVDLALQEYAGRNFGRCVVDFESINPEAAVFWMRYFKPVCYSVMRVPESV